MGASRKIPIYNIKCSILSAPEGSRTPNPQLRRLMLYPIELQAHYFRYSSEIFFFAGYRSRFARPLGASLHGMLKTATTHSVRGPFWQLQAHYFRYSSEIFFFAGSDPVSLAPLGFAPRDAQNGNHSLRSWAVLAAIGTGKPCKNKTASRRKAAGDAPNVRKNLLIFK